MITTCLDAFGTFLLFFATINIELGDIEGLWSIILVFFHFLAVIFTLPFLYNAIVRNNEIPLWFYQIIMVESVLNSLFMLLASNAVSGSKEQFIIFALFELIPLYLLRKNRYKILFW